MRLMSEGIIVALVTGLCSVLAVYLSNSKANSDMDAKLDKHQAVTDTKLEALTDEVRKHNSFAERIPVLETKLKSVEHRIDDLERKG